METQKVTVLAMFKAKPGSEDDLFHKLQALAGQARNDHGCISFECKQNRDEKALFVFVEQWACQEDLDMHLKQAYLETHREARAPYLDGIPQVSTWLD